MDMKKIASLTIILASLSTMTCLPETVRGEDLPPTREYASPADPAHVNDLGFELLKIAGAKKSNAMVSPWGIWASLRILVEGSQNETRKELLALIGPSGGKSEKTQSATFLTSELLLRKSHVALTDHFKTFVAQQGIESEESLFDDAARVKLNGWINDHSGKMIPNFFSSENWNPDAELMLCNVAAFHGLWANEFPMLKDRKDPSKSVSVQEYFRIDEQTRKRIPVMQDTRPLRWLSNDDLKFNSVVLPYKDEGLVAVVIVPQTDFGLPAVLDKINSTHLAAILTKAELQKVMIVLPKFCLDHSINVLDAIPRIQIADTDKADFSLMTKNRTKLSRVLQKSRIEVDEKGTQASQANLTESVPASTSNGGKLKQLIADQPFLFLIVHPKGLVLFATAVWNPTAIPTSVSN